uniref:Aquaporin n=1 Tax=Salix viminalis TaxID=40686 RepID=A0A6N2NE42_SALVM
MGGAIKGAIVDGILTAMWVFSVPLLGVFSSITATYVGVEPMSIAALFITINVAALLMLTFSLIGAALAGASFNPATTITLYMAGLKPDASLMSMALSFPAQAAGGVGGAMAIRGVMPDHHRHVLKGVRSLRVDLHTGAIAEGGPKNLVLKVWLLAVATVDCYAEHTTWDFFYVYWICPFIGAVLAAFVSKFLFKAAPIKEKKT